MIILSKTFLIVMDVDGTLTDGGIYMGNQGEAFKRFNAKDGYAISKILPQCDITPVILTGRESQIVLNRCKELGVTELFQGVSNKVESLKEYIKSKKIPTSEVAYIGDDLNDLECMKLCGLRGCPADACQEIQDIADFVSSKNGGDGAVREFIEWIVKQNEDSSVSTN